MNTHKCDISAEMVHSCRVLLGARAAGYPGVPDNFDAQHLAHGRRNGVLLDLVHAYAPATALPFQDRYTTTWARNRPNSRVVHNWKPLTRWAYAEAPESIQRFRQAARRIRTLERPCSIIVHHEPENDLDQPGIGALNAGTPEQYRRMWAIVREVFAEEGATDLTWGMAYMNYPKWDQVVADLWPGDDLVDWVWCNAYGSPERPDLAENIAHFTDLAERCGIGLGKPLGIAEWGTKGLTVEQAADYFDQARAFLDTPAADPIKAWMVFDSPGKERRSDLRVGFDAEGNRAKRKAEAYRRFARHRRFRCVAQ